MRQALLHGLLILSLLLSTPVEAAILVIAEPDVNPLLVRNVQQVADAFDHIVATELGVTLNKDVKVFVTPTRAAYIDVLQRELGMSKDVAERSGKITSGFSASRRQAVALNGESTAMKSLGGLSSVAAHELFHQVQGQLEGDKWVRLYWISEGAADYVGAMVADRLGVMSLNGWKQQRINLLRKTPGHASPRELANVNLAQWSNLMEQGKLPYTVSDMMIVFLLEQSKGRTPAAIAEYFRQCLRLQNGEKALKAAFGMSMNDFETHFAPWFSSLMTQAASVTITASGPVSPLLLEEARSALQALSGFWEDQWNFPLQSNLRVILVSSAAEYKNALTHELGYTPSAAGQLLTETWRFNRNTAILRVDTPDSPELRAQRLAEIVARMWVADTISSKSAHSLFWLRSGGVLCSAAMATDAQYSGAAVRQQELWLQRLGAENPPLTSLASVVEYQAAIKRHSAKKTEAVSALATQLLFEKHGLNAYGHWLQKAKIFGDDERAFAAVYGYSWEEFAAEFQNWLQSKLKKAA